jgi:hypothetical protein
MTPQEESKDSALTWAGEIARDTFRAGLLWTFDKDRVSEAVRRWYQESDPVYLPLLSGLSELRRQRFVADWRLAQTLATNCRFFMEETIARILLHPNQREMFGRQVFAVYTHRDLAEGHLGRFPDITFMGEDRKEWAMARGWDARIRGSALDAVDRIALREDRLHDQVLAASGNRLDRVQDNPGIRTPFTKVIKVILSSLEGDGSWERLFLACNLVVVDEPEKGFVHAFRFINTRNASKKDVQADRKNYLRLLAYIQQEKFLRSPEKLRVVVSPLVDRQSSFSSNHHALRFSEEEYWPASRFWEFVRVQFTEVRNGIAAAGKDLPGLLEGLHELPWKPGGQLGLFDQA